MKKLFTLFIAVLASVSMSRAEVYEGSCGNPKYGNSSITWSLNTEDSTLTLSGKGYMYDYQSGTAPWYQYRSYIKSIILNDGINVIGRYAFYDCFALTSVNIGYSLDVIGNYAFCDCKNLEQVTFNSSLRLVTIGEYAFSGCKSLFSLEIPSSAANIWTNAFYNVPNVIYSGTATGAPWGAKCVNGYIEGPLLYSNDTKQTLVYCSKYAQGIITLPNSVTTIRDETFSNCSQITKIIIPESVTTIWDSFVGCTNLQSFEVDENNTYFRAIDGILYSCYGNVVYELKKMPSQYIGDYVMPKTVVTMGCYAIMDVPGLTSITFSPLLDDWCAAALGTCENLQNVIFTCRDTIYPNERNYFPETCTITKTNGVTTQLPDTTVCPGEIVYGEPVYSSVEHSETYTAVNGCDSIVKRNIIIKEPKQPHIVIRHIGDTVLSGTIYLYDAYTYAYETYSDTTWADYDYITVNGIRYDHPATHDASQVYNTYKFANNSNIEPSFKIENLSAGDYFFEFHYTDCENYIYQDVQIKRYGMKVNGMYYLLDDENHTAVLSYRGESYSSYSNEYSGNITIPETITFEGEEYQVTGINSNTFSDCNNIQSITIESETPIYMPYNSGLPTNCIVYVPFGSLNAYKTSSYWSNYNIHILNPSHVTTTSGATSVSVVFGNSDEQKHIASCGIEGGVQTAGYVLDYIGLEPNSEYQNVPLSINTKEGDCEIISLSFTTSALELTTQPSKPVSSTTAILLANTNIADIETSCGFEWKRDNAPEGFTPTKVYCPVASGQMAGRLKNLKDDVYYTYRAFYQSAAGTMYYGEWQYIFTGDVAIEFDPILYTYGASVVRENEATISGYALAGSEDFTEQGFEYWAENRANASNAPFRAPAALGEHIFVQASGISLRVTLTDLDAGTVYKYRVYGKVGDQMYYGAEQTFTTTGTYTPPTYMITFLNWDGTELQKSPVEENTMPVYTGETPTRPETSTHIYTFKGWRPELVVATEDATYTATFTATAKQQDPVYYTITFINWDETVLQTLQVDEGEKPVYTGETPTRPDDEDYTYTFAKWSPIIVEAYDDATYKAIFTAEEKSQGFDHVQSDVPCTKVLRDGQIYILRGDKIYTVVGTIVR